jgi:hypothetical protein
MKMYHAPHEQRGGGRRWGAGSVGSCGGYLYPRELGVSIGGVGVRNLDYQRRHAPPLALPHAAAAAEHRAGAATPAQRGTWQ